tara:strand:+ start:280 stop:2271 length:1992 start_codon:yes stop_codon:yes gene_type:complete
MATPEELKNAAKIATEEFGLLNDQLIGINGQIKAIVKTSEGLDDVTKNIVKTYQGDFNSAVNSIKKSGREVALLQAKQAKGAKLDAAEQKKLANAQSNVAKQRAIAESSLTGLKINGAKISEQQVYLFGEGVNKIENQITSADKLNTELTVQRGITGSVVDNAKAYLIKMDQTGLAAIALNGDLSTTQKLTLASEAAMLALAKGALAGSDNINNLQKNLGISYESAHNLQNSLALTAANSDKLFITSKALNESFSALAETTGILSDFGGDTLVTMTTLTKQLGLGVKEASQLALLARTQGTDTESVLENTVDTVNAINRQNKSAISAKAVLNDIASASASIVVSLGMSPELLAEAATEARALGISLAGVDAIAGSLLDFETSIENELAFQLITGKEINLDKARQLALDNDLAGLSEEIGNNAAITEAFATGNRIEQQAAAAALGMSRDSMAEMVMQQAYLNLGQDEFIEKFGEQSYQAMQSQSASEKFQATMEKIQGIIGDIGTAFAPIIDGFAAIVGFIAESSVGAAVLVGILTTLAGLSIAASIANIMSSFSMVPFGIGVPLGIAAVAGLMAAIGVGISKAQTVQDGIAPSDRGPFTITDAYGAMAVTAKGDNLAVSPNINQGGGDSRMISLLEKIASKDSNVYMDSQKVGTSLSVATNRI